jgi:hypothetical protein
VGAEPVRAEGEDVDLVEGDPVRAQVAQAGDEGRHPCGEALGAVGVEPEVHTQPVGVGEVVEGDQRLESSIVAGGQDPPVVLDGVVVDLVGGGLAPRPLDRQAEGVATQRLDPVQVLVEAVPEVDADPGRLDCGAGDA